MTTNVRPFEPIIGSLGGENITAAGAVQRTPHFDDLPADFYHWRARDHQGDLTGPDRIKIRNIKTGNPQSLPHQAEEVARETLTS